MRFANVLRTRSKKEAAFVAARRVSEEKLFVGLRAFRQRLLLREFAIIHPFLTFRGRRRRKRKRQ